METSDLISRKWLMECIDEGWIKFDTERDKNIYIHLVRDIAPSVQSDTQYLICMKCRKRLLKILYPERGNNE